MHQASKIMQNQTEIKGRQNGSECGIEYSSNDDSTLDYEPAAKTLYHCELDNLDGENQTINCQADINPSKLKNNQDNYDYCGIESTLTQKFAEKFPSNRQNCQQNDVEQKRNCKEIEQLKNQLLQMKIEWNAEKSKYSQIESELIEAHSIIFKLRQDNLQLDQELQVTIDKYKEAKIQLGRMAEEVTLTNTRARQSEIEKTKAESEITKLRNLLETTQKMNEYLLGRNQAIRDQPQKNRVSSMDFRSVQGKEGGIENESISSLYYLSRQINQSNMSTQSNEQLIDSGKQSYLSSKTSNKIEPQIIRKSYENSKQEHTNKDAILIPKISSTQQKENRYENYCSNPKGKSDKGSAIITQQHTHNVSAQLEYQKVVKAVGDTEQQIIELTIQCQTLASKICVKLLQKNNGFMGSNEFKIQQRHNSTQITLSDMICQY